MKISSDRNAPGKVVVESDAGSSWQRALKVATLVSGLVVSTADKGCAQDGQTTPTKNRPAPGALVDDLKEGQLILRPPGNVAQADQNPQKSVDPQSRKDLTKLYADLEGLKVEDAQRALAGYSYEETLSLVRDRLAERGKRLENASATISRGIDAVLAESEILNRLADRLFELERPDSWGSTSFRDSLKDLGRKTEALKRSVQSDNSSWWPVIGKTVWSIGVLGYLFRSTIHALLIRRALNESWDKLKGALDRHPTDVDLSDTPQFVLRPEEIAVCKEFRDKIPAGLQEFLGSFGMRLAIGVRGNAKNWDPGREISFVDIPAVNCTVTIGIDQVRQIKPLMRAFMVSRFGFRSLRKESPHDERDSNSFSLVNDLIRGAVNTLLYDPVDPEEPRKPWIQYAKIFWYYADKFDSREAGFFSRIQQAASLPSNFFASYRSAEITRLEIRSSNPSDALLSELSTSIKSLMKFLQDGGESRDQRVIAQVIKGFIEDCNSDLPAEDATTDPLSWAALVRGNNQTHLENLTKWGYTKS
jgi:hypothetical protein